jgi:hypothetical protein
VVAEKAGVKLSPEAKAAASTKGGGGERARLPAVTATDEKGRAEGFTGGSYGRKAARTPGPMAPTPAQPAPRPAAPAPRPAASAPPPPPPAPPASPAPAPASAPVRSGAMRFSSLSGFRRR